MKILSIEYKIAGLGSRKIDFCKEENKCVVIRGKNYSGKTVLLNLLSPKAIDKSYLFNNELAGVFSEKLLTIEKDSNIFELYSRVVASGISCSFKVNGEEKCSNGKVTNYNELLKNYGLDNTIDIIDQHASYFFDLSPIERKKYIQENYINDHSLIEKWREYVTKRSNFISSKIVDIVNYRTNNNAITLNEEAMKLLVLKDLFVKSSNELMIMQSDYEKIKPHNLSIPAKLPEDVFTEEYIKTCELIDAEQRRNLIFEIEKDILQISNDLNAINTINNFKKELCDIGTFKFANEALPSISDIIKLLEIYEVNAIKSISLQQPLYTLEYHDEKIKEFEDKIESANSDIEKIDREINTLRGVLQANNSMITKGKDNPCVKEECLAKLQEENIEIASKIDNLVENTKRQITVDIQSWKEKVEKGKLVRREDAIRIKAIDDINLFVTENKRLAVEKSKDFVDLFEGICIENGNLEAINLKLLREEFANSAEQNRRIESNRIINGKITVLTNTIKNNGISKNELDDILLSKKYEVESGNILLVNKKRIEENKILWDLYLKNAEVVKSKDELLGKINELKLYIAEINYSEQRYNDIQFIITRLKQETVEENTLSEELDKLLNLKDILNVNGLPKILIQGELIKLENLINSNINKYFTDDIKLNFDYTDKKLDINIRTKHSPSNTYENLSGAEKSIVKICCSLAFQQDNMTVVRLDEIDAFFDEDNRLSFSSFLDNLANHSDQVFCISHNQELLDNKNFMNINLSKD